MDGASTHRIDRQLLSTGTPVAKKKVTTFFSARAQRTAKHTHAHTHSLDHTNLSMYLCVCLFVCGARLCHSRRKSKIKTVCPQYVIGRFLCAFTSTKFFFFSFRLFLGYNWLNDFPIGGIPSNAWLFFSDFQQENQWEYWLLRSDGEKLYGIRREYANNNDCILKYSTLRSWFTAIDAINQMNNRNEMKNWCSEQWNVHWIPLCVTHLHLNGWLQKKSLINVFGVADGTNPTQINDVHWFFVVVAIINRRFSVLELNFFFH